MEQVSKETGISLSTLRKWAASGAIDPRCGRRFGYVWRFKRSVIEEEGILVNREKIRCFRDKYPPSGQDQLVKKNPAGGGGKV